jgi:hypothetical protein
MACREEENVFLATNTAHEARKHSGPCTMDGRDARRASTWRNLVRAGWEGEKKSRFTNFKHECFRIHLNHHVV